MLTAFTAGFLALLLVATGPEARAATGWQVWTDGGSWGTTVDCSTPDCLGPGVSMTVTTGPAASWVATSTRDPREALTCWPGCSSFDFPGMTLWYSGVVSRMTQTVTLPAGTRYVWTVDSGRGRTLVDLQASEPPATPTPTTTPPAPTTTPPAPETSAPPTTTAPAPSSSPGAPSTETGSGPTAGSGGGMTCTEEAPCPVRVVDGVTVDVGSLEVSALTEDQWLVIETTAGVLTFFAAASFFTTIRRRGA
jgi:hypothetical protein